jgi:ABC-type Fe3+-siderophore transport system permease subunit
MVSRRRWVMALLASFIALVLALLLAVRVGSRPLDLSRALHGISPDHEILMELRLPRALLALWTGGALALSGVLFQALLREALATPYTLGISGGASLGAVISICLGWGTSGKLPVVCTAAFLGAGAVLILVLMVASAGGQLSSFSLILAGITINSLCSAIILFLSNLANFIQSFGVIRWLMGGLDAPAYSTLAWLTLVLAPVCLLIFWYGREWNVLAVGEKWAATHGVSPKRMLLFGCIAGSLLAGAVTALTGPIGFVGLIVPHALRLWLGGDHRILAPCSFLLGAAFVALCDVFSRTILAPVEVPVGVITAMLGGPFFLSMLLQRRRTISP